MYGAVVSCCSLISELVLATTADHSPYMALEPSGETMLSEHHKWAIKNTHSNVHSEHHTHLTSLHHYKEILALIRIWSDSAVQSQLDGASLEIVKNHYATLSRTLDLSQTQGVEASSVRTKIK